MVTPVPNHSVGTPYGKRGSYWSCDEDENDNGVHTGVDYPAPSGTPVVAARGGTARYCSHGAAFGNWQLEVVCADGTRDFYAHMSGRTVKDGATVQTGQQVGTVGASGNVTGPHLHFERHKVASGGWSCSVHTDPQPSIAFGSDEMELGDSIALWSPEDNKGGQTTVGKTLNQARGYAEDAYRRSVDIEKKLDQILKLLQNQ